MMREYVGVIDPFIFARDEMFNTSLLKRHALIFSRLAILGLTDGFFDANKYMASQSAIAEMEWLLDQGVIFEPKFNEKIVLSTPEHEEEFEASIRHALGMIGVLFGVDLNKLRLAWKGEGSALTDEELEELHRNIENIKKINPEDFMMLAESEDFLNHVSGMLRHQTRMLSIELRETASFDAYPILATPIPITHISPAAKNEVIQIVLESLPLPDDSTPWEQILEFRSDPDSYNKFVDLRNWMSEVARSALPPAEIEEKLEYLLRQYQRHMELHKMKTNTGTLETVLVTTGEVLENLATLKIGQAAKILFATKRQKIMLLEGELTSPGSEVAYIVKARDSLA